MMVTIPRASAVYEPVLAKRVIRTCSFKLKGPGFNENDHFVPRILMGFSGRYAAINFPIGSTKIWAVTEERESAF